jgi:hypothetical protein
MDSRIEAILLKFPLYRDSILKEITENEEFGNLCNDYELCVKKLKDLQNEGIARRAALEEWLELRIELEHELLKYLD